MSNLQIIQVIINELLREPTEAYKISNKLLKLGFASDHISLTFDALSDTNQIKVDKYWKLYLNPIID